MHATDIRRTKTVVEIRQLIGISEKSALSIGSLPILLGVISTSLLFIFAISIQPWAPVADLLRDPLAVAEMSETCCKVYFGAVSNLGAMLWFMAGAVCLFTAAILFALGERNRRVGLMLGAGLLTGWLGGDDLFMVHDQVLPELGVPQLVTYGTYASLALTYLALFWREILQSRAPVFLAAGALLAASVGIDVLIHSNHPSRILMEDGAKLIGIALWGAFHVAAAFDYMLEACQSRAERHAGLRHQESR